MTKKRDLKRRVRERQARTGESYVTASEGEHPTIWLVRAAAG